MIQGEKKWNLKLNKKLEDIENSISDMEAGTVADIDTYLSEIEEVQEAGNRIGDIDFRLGTIPGFQLPEGQQSVSIYPRFILGETGLISEVFISMSGTTINISSDIFIVINGQLFYIPAQDIETELTNNFILVARSDLKLSKNPRRADGFIGKDKWFSSNLLEEIALGDYLTVYETKKNKEWKVRLKDIDVGWVNLDTFTGGAVGVVPFPDLEVKNLYKATLQVISLEDYFELTGNVEDSFICPIWSKINGDGIRTEKENKYIEGTVINSVKGGVDLNIENLVPGKNIKERILVDDEIVFTPASSEVDVTQAGILTYSTSRVKASNGTSINLTTVTEYGVVQ